MEGRKQEELQRRGRAADRYKFKANIYFTGGTYHKFTACMSVYHSYHPFSREPTNGDGEMFQTSLMHCNVAVGEIFPGTQLTQVELKHGETCNRRASACAGSQKQAREPSASASAAGIACGAVDEGGNLLRL